MVQCIQRNLKIEQLLIDLYCQSINCTPNYSSTNVVIMWIMFEWMMWQLIQWPKGRRFKEVLDGFQQLQGISHVVGAIDGTHIAVSGRENFNENYINRKGYPSIILQAVCLWPPAAFHWCFCRLGWISSWCPRFWKQRPERAYWQWAVWKVSRRGFYARWLRLQTRKLHDGSLQRF